MDEQKKAIVADKIKTILPSPECPMCHNREFTIVDSYFINPVVDDYKQTRAIIRKSIPAAAIVCTYCGYISLHALGVLGLLEQESESNQQEEKENSEQGSM